MLGYRFAIDDLALRIEHERCPALEVTLEPWRLVVSVRERRRAFGLCEIEDLAAHVMAELERERRAGVKRLPLWLVGGHLLGLRERGLERVNPAVAGVLRAVLAVAPHVPRLAGVPALHGAGFVARDVVRHRAAAIALASLDEHLLAPWLARRGLSCHAPDDVAAIAALGEWRGLFSPDGRSYRSLDRTLMNLPATIAGGRLHRLRRVRLERPVTGPLVLAALLLLLDDRRYGSDPDAFAGHVTVLQRSAEDDVAEACALLARHTRRDLDPRREDGLAFLVTYLLDEPGGFHGTLPGLVHRAIRRHVRRAELVARVHAASDATPPPPEPRWPAPLGGRSLAAPPQRAPGLCRRPPIPLPRVPGVRFLDTVAAIQAEGARMEHCIADYADDAIQGACYLFHVSHEGAEASVEVDPRGQVRQASGPRNVDNAASRFGSRVLGEWGRQLRRGGTAESAMAPPRADPAAAAIATAQLALWR